MNKATDDRDKLSIDLTDPYVRNMLGPTLGVATGQTPSVVQIAGDRGASSTTRLTAGKQETVVIYQGMLLTADVYALPGEPVKVHIICPRCRKCSTINGDHKAIEWDPTAANPVRGELEMANRQIADHSQRFPLTGRISISEFECSWEVGDDKHVTSALHTGASLCRLRLVIDNNRARKA